MFYFVQLLKICFNLYDYKKYTSRLKFQRIGMNEFTSNNFIFNTTLIIIVCITIAIIINYLNYINQYKKLNF